MNFLSKYFFLCCCFRSKLPFVSMKIAHKSAELYFDSMPFVFTILYPRERKHHKINLKTKKKKKLALFCVYLNIENPHSQNRHSNDDKNNKINLFLWVLSLSIQQFSRDEIGKIPQFSMQNYLLAGRLNKNLLVWGVHRDGNCLVVAYLSTNFSDASFTLAVELKN